jgi:arylformamidase
LNPRIIDISPPISERLAVFPGDEPYRESVDLDIESGDPVRLTSIRATLHLGSHADAPSHCLQGGAAIDALPLELFYGPCQVVHVRVASGGRVGPDDLPEPVESPRVLFRTDSFLDPERLDEAFAGLSPELVRSLHRSGVRLVGIDTPSIDPYLDPVLERHLAAARLGMVNLEGLVLRHVDPGFYTLVAMPLRLAGAEASPVRAVLVRATPEFPG